MGFTARTVYTRALAAACKVAVGALICLTTAGCQTKLKNQIKGVDGRFGTTAYDLAMTEALTLIKERPGNSETRGLLKKQAPVYFARKEEEARAADSTDRFDDAIAAYARIQEVEQRLKELPEDARAAIAATGPDVGASLQSVRDRAATKCYTDAEAMEGSGDARNAARSFKRADLYVPGFRNARGRYEIDRAKGMRRVLILPMKNETGQAVMNGLGQAVADMLEEALVSSADFSEYTEYFPWDEFARRLAADGKPEIAKSMDPALIAREARAAGCAAMVSGTVRNAVLSFPPATSATEDRMKTIMVSNGQFMMPVVVRAALEHFTLSGSAGLTVEFSFLEFESNKLIQAEPVSRELKETRTWARCTGDARALELADRALCAQPEGRFEPAPFYLRHCALQAALEIAPKINTFMK